VWWRERCALIDAGTVQMRKVNTYFCRGSANFAMSSSSLGSDGGTGPSFYLDKLTMIKSSPSMENLVRIGTGGLTTSPSVESLDSLTGERRQFFSNCPALEQPMEQSLASISKSPSLGDLVSAASVLPRSPSLQRSTSLPQNQSTVQSSQLSSQQVDETLLRSIPGVAAGRESKKTAVDTSKYRTFFSFMQFEEGGHQF